jgi:hypothetical protein
MRAKTGLILLKEEELFVCPLIIMRKELRRL